jgi:hypothetical protein
MNIKQIGAFVALLPNFIIMGCSTLGPAQVFPVSASDNMVSKSETPVSSETPSLSVTQTLHPSLINCFATPVTVFDKELLDTPGAQEIIDTIQKSEEIYFEALQTSDPGKFPTVFINDPRFPLPEGTLNTVRRLTDNPSLQSAGWLDYKMAYHTFQIKEGTYLQMESFPSEPSQTLPPDFTWCSPPPPLKFLSININQDIAIATIDAGATKYELTLVLIKNHWFIASFNGISVSP